MPGGNYLASGIEHNETGAPTASGAVHARMNEKRIRKLAPARGAPRPVRHRMATRRRAARHRGLGQRGRRGARGARARAAQRGCRSSCSCRGCCIPWPQQVYEEFFASVRAGLVVEQSHQGQLYRLLRMFVDVPAGCCASVPQRIEPVHAGRAGGSSPRSRDRAAARRRLPELETQSD